MSSRFREVTRTEMGDFDTPTAYLAQSFHAAAKKAAVRHFRKWSEPTAVVHIKKLGTDEVRSYDCVRTPSQTIFTKRINCGECIKG